MKKQILIFTILLALLLAGPQTVQAKTKRSGRAKVTRTTKKATPTKTSTPKKTDTKTTIKTNMTKVAQGPSTTLRWTGVESGAAYYFNLEKTENAKHLQNMLTIPYNFTKDEIAVVTHGEYDKKIELARKKLKQSGALPQEWFQFGYIAGLYNYMKDREKKLKDWDKKKLRFIRFMEMYVIPIYLNRHEDLRKDSNYNNMQNYLDGLHGFSFADNPDCPKKTVSTRDAQTKFTSFASPDQGGSNNGKKEDECAQGTSTQNQKTGNGGNGNSSNGNNKGGGQGGGGNGGGPGGVAGGSPYGVAGGTILIEDEDVLYYDPDLVYEDDIPHNTEIQIRRS